jgi:uncharacterized membrane protein
VLLASLLALRFLAYSLLGWLLEGTLRCLMERRFVNPGFLSGPFVPIYGVGALSILVLTRDVRSEPVMVFVMACVVASVVEFVGHLVLQRMLGLVLWDYSGRFGNLQGRICLGNSLSFGAAGVALVYGIEPLLGTVLDALDPTLAIALASGLMALLVADWATSMAAVVRLRPEIQAIEGSLIQVRHRLEARLEVVGAEYDRRSTRVLNRSRRALARLESAFPNAHTAPASDHSATNRAQRTERSIDRQTTADEGATGRSAQGAFECPQRGELIEVCVPEDRFV